MESKSSQLDENFTLFFATDYTNFHEFFCFFRVNPWQIQGVLNGYK